jgi:hypothetical protein
MFNAKNTIPTETVIYVNTCHRSMERVTQLDWRVSRKTETKGTVLGFCVALLSLDHYKTTLFELRFRLGMFWTISPPFTITTLIPSRKPSCIEITIRDAFISMQLTEFSSWVLPHYYKILFIYLSLGLTILSFVLLKPQFLSVSHIISYTVATIHSYACHDEMSSCF